MSNCNCDHKPVRRFEDLDPQISAREFIRAESRQPGIYTEPRTQAATDAAARTVTDAEVAHVVAAGAPVAEFLNARLGFGDDAAKKRASVLEWLAEWRRKRKRKRDAAAAQMAAAVADRPKRKAKPIPAR